MVFIKKIEFKYEKLLVAEQIRYKNIINSYVSKRTEKDYLWWLSQNKVQHKNISNIIKNRGKEIASIIHFKAKL